MFWGNLCPCQGKCQIFSGNLVSYLHITSNFIQPQFCILISQPVYFVSLSFNYIPHTAPFQPLTPVLCIIVLQLYPPYCTILAPVLYFHLALILYILPAPSPSTAHMAIVYGYVREVLVINLNNYILRVSKSRQDCGIKLNTKLST